MLKKTIVIPMILIFPVNSWGCFDKNQDNKTNFSNCYKAAEQGEIEAQYPEQGVVKWIGILTRSFKQ